MAARLGLCLSWGTSSLPVPAAPSLGRSWHKPHPSGEEMVAAGLGEEETEPSPFHPPLWEAVAPLTTPGAVPSAVGSWQGPILLLHCPPGGEMPPPEARKELLWEEEEEEGVFGALLRKEMAKPLPSSAAPGAAGPLLAPLVLIRIKAEPGRPEQPLPSTCCLLRALLCSQDFLRLCRGFALPKGGFSVGHSHAGFSRVTLCGVMGLSPA